MREKCTRERKGIKVNYTEYESVSYAIVDSLATIKKTEVTKLDPLFDSVDLESIDLLFDSKANDDLIIEQRIDGYVITIRGDGVLTISDSNRQ